MKRAIFIKGIRTLEVFRLALGLKKSKYYGIINVHQVIKLLEIDVPLHINRHIFYFERFEV